MEDEIEGSIIFTRLNRWIIDRLPSRRLSATLVKVSSAGLHFRQSGRERVVRWQQIDRVEACMSGELIGDTQVLYLGGEAQEIVSANEADPAWRTLIEELPIYLPGAKRAAVWQLELIASGGPTQIYRR